MLVECSQPPERLRKGLALGVTTTSLDIVTDFLGKYTQLVSGSRTNGGCSPFHSHSTSVESPDQATPEAWTWILSLPEYLHDRRRCHPNVWNTLPWYI